MARGVVVAGVLLLAAAFAASETFRWRVQVVGLRITGEIPDVGWLDLVRMLRPSSGFYLKPLLWRPNPYRTIINPDTSAADIEAGARAFQSRCAQCHGRDARGGTGPPLVGKPRTRGHSDWAVFCAVSRGVPGTAMPKSDLPAGERWRIVAFLRALRRDADSTGARMAQENPHHRTAPRCLRGCTRRGQGRLCDWLMYSGAYDGQRYSRLSQINRANVSRLRLLWIYQAGGSDPRFETSPLVVDGILFLTTPANGVRALDAETGALLWSYDRELQAEMTLCCGRVNRGHALLDSTLYTRHGRCPPGGPRCGDRCGALGRGRGGRRTVARSPRLRSW